VPRQSKKRRVFVRIVFDLPKAISNQRPNLQNGSKFCTVYLKIISNGCSKGLPILLCALPVIQKWSPTLRFGTQSLISLHLFLMPVSCLFSPLISELEGSRATPSSSSSSAIIAKQRCRLLPAEQRRCPLQAPPPPLEHRGLVVWGHARGRRWSGRRGTTPGGWGTASGVSNQEQWFYWIEAMAHGEWSRLNGAPIGDH
jgi:hypothetical protein